MPEGPEAKYLELFLRNKILGYQFDKIVSNTKTIRKLPQKSKVIDTGCKGKILWLRTKDYWVHLHMGLSGWLVEEKPRIYKYVLYFKKGKQEKVFYLSDRRRFSRIDIHQKLLDHNKSLEKLGICLFCPQFTLDNFLSQIGNSSRNVSAFLLDQTKIAGIGNYIRNDALYIARINPRRKLSTLSSTEIKKLYNAIKFIVFSNLLTWLDDENLKTPSLINKLSPKKVSVPYRMRVYGREVDQAGRKVKFVKSIAGRRTYFVPQIQK